jgi:pimeloyl-ACP methyl ester carboxylesterase
MVFKHRDVEIYYEAHGEAGKPLLLLHGWGGKCASWKPVIRDFSADRRVFALDFPGHGRSSEPPVPWSVADHAEMAESLLRFLGIAVADIIGHSHGGRVAIALAADKPHLVGKLVLAASAGLTPRRGLGFQLRSRAFKLMSAAASGPLARGIFGRQFVDSATERLAVRFGSSDYRALSTGMRKTFSLLVNQDLRPCLARIKSPVLLIWGDLDDETPLWMAREMERGIAGATLEVLSGCGHFAYLERYSDFKVLVKRFFTSVRG